MKDRAALGVVTDAEAKGRCVMYYGIHCATSKVTEHFHRQESSLGERLLKVRLETRESDLRMFAERVDTDA